MKEIRSKKLEFTSTKGRRIEVDFRGGAVSSDGGLLLMREADRRTGFIERISRRIDDERQVGKVAHETAALIRQRVLALAAGWEDLNDAEALRHDPVHQAACGSE